MFLLLVVFAFFSLLLFIVSLLGLQFFGGLLSLCSVSLFVGAGPMSGWQTSPIRLLLFHMFNIEFQLNKRFADRLKSSTFCFAHAHTSFIPFILHHFSHQYFMFFVDNVDHMKLMLKCLLD